mgnify:CR=1 FL=1
MLKVSAAKRPVLYLEYLEEEIGKLTEPRDIHIDEKHFRKKRTDEAKIYTPAGYIPEIRPNFPTEAAKLADERDALRFTNPDNPRI